MSDVEHRPAQQFCLTIAHELAHGGVDAKETEGFGIDRDLAYAAEVKHGTERHFALVECGFGTFEAGDVSNRCNQPGDFGAPPVWLIIAMHELSLVGAVRQIDFKLELDRLAAEALPEVGLEGPPGLLAHDLRDVFADHLLGREAFSFLIGLLPKSTPFPCAALLRAPPGCRCALPRTGPGC